ncbi:MAG: malonyl-ACP O-methyltransferase BioC [Bacteroidales bacterium]|jgi:malonyl-ACP O-methyltransferase BioC|nr:malonyl-ACP O-methyltransferase BioC [Bacteroidales bacterium]
MIVAEKQRVAKRFGKQIQSYKKYATVQKNICDRVIAILLQHSLTPAQVLEIGCGTGFLTEQFLTQFNVQSYMANDIAAEMGTELQRISLITGQTIDFLPGDAETIALDKQFDTILSTSTLQWFHNISGFFGKMHNMLRDRGIFAFSTFGTENFREITTLTNQSLAYSSAEELCALLADNFHVLHCETYCKTLFFNEAVDVLRHIKQTGVNNLSASLWTNSRLQQFSTAYRDLFYTNNGFTLTYNPIIIVAKKIS